MTIKTSILQGSWIKASANLPNTISVIFIWLQALGVQASDFFQQQKIPSLLSSILRWSRENQAKKKEIMWMKTKVMPMEA